jgi:transposase
MRIRTVFKKLLCLQGAGVRHVGFRRDGETILVSVVRRAWRHRCPHCAFTTRATYDRHPREWRHLSLGRWRVLVASTSHRITCPEHGVVNEAFPWAAPGSLFTLDFEALVASSVSTEYSVRRRSGAARSCRRRPSRARTTIEDPHRLLRHQRANPPSRARASRRGSDLYSRLRK